MTEELEVLKGIDRFSKKFPLLTPEEEQIHIHTYQNTMKNSKEWKHALDILVTRNLRLVLTYAKKPDGGTLTVYDLFVEGVLGLIHAIDKYDATRLNEKGKPMKLSTYATWWIKQYIQRAIQDKGRTIRIPIHIHDLLNKVCKVYGEHCSTHFDESAPTSKILSALTGIPQEMVERIGRHKHKIGSLDEATNEDENLSVGSYLAADFKYQPESTIEQVCNRIELIKLISQLNHKGDKDFLMLKYGLIDGVDRNDKEMAIVYKCKPKDITKREKSLVEQLQIVANRNRFNL